ncbi:MAG: hypothetical protein ACE5J7_00395 [Candidatus Aenigmatarchaeota archaeon]
MQDFRYFSKDNIAILQRELTILQGTYDDKYHPEDELVTGYNYYLSDALDPKALVIAISLLQRAKKLKKEFYKDLRSNPHTRVLLSEERTREIPLERDKRAIYRAGPLFEIQRDPETKELDKDTILFDLETFEDIPEDIVERCKYAKDVTKIEPKYKHIGIKELGGYDIILNIKKKKEAQEVLKLLRRKSSRYELGIDGMPLRDKHNKIIKKDPDKIWPGADETPCIILGEKIEEFLGEELLDFTKCTKTYIIKEIEEVSFLTCKTTPQLLRHKSYLSLKSHFGSLMGEPVLAYVNNYMVREYIDVVVE